MSVYVFMCRHVYVYENDLFHVCSYVHILHLHVCYNYVQRCEDTVGVELWLLLLLLLINAAKMILEFYPDSYHIETTIRKAHIYIKTSLKATSL